MALVTCKVCKNQISASAEVCPQCGHPHEKDRKNQKEMRSTLFILALGVLFVILLKTGLLEKIIDSIEDGLFK